MKYCLLFEFYGMQVGFLKNKSKNNSLLEYGVISHYQHDLKYEFKVGVMLFGRSKLPY